MDTTGAAIAVVRVVRDVRLAAGVDVTGTSAGAAGSVRKQTSH